MGPRPHHRRSWFERYQQHVWIGGLSLLVIVAALGPIVVASLGRSPSAPERSTAAAPSNLPTSVT
ncbi:MAG TPA: hypothetical protein VF937_00290, partial [Chloroflexota bacterium]